MINISDQVKEALELRRRTTADLAKWLGVGQRAAQKKLSQDNWKAYELSILSEKLEYQFDVNANFSFASEEPASYHAAAKKTIQPLQLSITLDGQGVDRSKVNEFLDRWNELVAEFTEKSE